MTDRFLNQGEQRGAVGRHGLELLWVVIVLALSVRIFFFHPMSVPTGSMEPTFRGAWSRPIAEKDSRVAGSWVRRWYERLLFGRQYVDILAQEGGTFRIIDRSPLTVGMIALRQRFSIGDHVHTVWFPPQHLWERAGLESGRSFSKGDSVIRRVFGAGDRIFVNRWIYNFRPPRRGESVVFDAREAEANPSGEFYLKRLVGLGGESISIGDDRLIRIDGQILELFVFSAEGVKPATEGTVTDDSVGYLNGATAHRLGLHDSAPLFPTADVSLNLEGTKVFVVGDNSGNSRDGRTWGGLSREAIIGRPAFVFWPFTERFGVAPR